MPYSLDDIIRRAWRVLIEAAEMGRTVTYTELAGRAGPPLNRRHVHRQLLTPLAIRCREAGLPDLSALVVRKDTRKPGGGWFEPGGDESAWHAALEACFTYRWPVRPDPRLLRPVRTPKARRS